MRDRHLRCVYNLEGLGNPSSCWRKSGATTKKPSPAP